VSVEFDGLRRPYSKGDFISLCGGLVRNGFTGTLEVYHQRTTRVLMLIGGDLVGMVSDLSADAIENQLLLDEVVTKAEISSVNGKNRHEGRSGHELRVEERLLRRRCLSRQELSNSNYRRIEAAVGIIFELDGAEYALFPNEKLGSLGGVGIEEGLVSKRSLLSLFWRPATRASEWIMGEVTKFEGQLSPTDTFDKAISDLGGVSFPLERFRGVMGKCPSVESVYLEFPQEAALFPMLWLLVKYGAISTGEVSDVAEVDEQPANVDKGVGMQGASQRTLEEWESLISLTYDERMGLGCYGFINSHPSATREEVDTACKDMLRELKPALMVQSMPEETFDKLDKLLIGVKNVWRTLSDASLRREYDSDLEAGYNYKVVCVPGAVPVKLGKAEKQSAGIETSPLSERLKAALNLVERSQYSKALPMLESERLRDPNSAAVLTGIARCHLGVGRVEDSLDFFNLALVFNPSDYRALRGIAEVNLVNEDLEAAHQALQVLEEVHPLDEWVQSQLSKFRTSNKKDKRSIFSWGRKRK